MITISSSNKFSLNLYSVFYTQQRSHHDHFTIFIVSIEPPKKTFTIVIIISNRYTTLWASCPFAIKEWCSHLRDSLPSNYNYSSFVFNQVTSCPGQIVISSFLSVYHHERKSHNYNHGPLSLGIEKCHDYLGTGK